MQVGRLQAWKDAYNVELLNEFNVTQGYYVKHLPCITLLLLRFEDISRWESILKEIGYEFRMSHSNRHRYLIEGQDIIQYGSQDFRMPAQRVEVRDKQTRTVYIITVDLAMECS